MPLLFSGTSLAGRAARRQLVRLAVISVAALGALPAASAMASAQVEEEDRIAASFVLARGRLPAAAEVSAWQGSAASPFPDLLARHREQLRQDSAALQAVAARASLDAFGVQPGPAPPDGQAGDGTYLEGLRRHLRYLATHPEEYATVVQRAYRLVLRRDAYAPELEYWARRPVLSFALLAACVDDWARRNQPGLTVTSGPAAVNVNSRLIVTVRLSPAGAAELRAAAGFPRPRGSAAALGRHVVAPGAEEVASVGGIHFAAAGAPDLALVEAEASTSRSSRSHIVDLEMEVDPFGVDSRSSRSHIVDLEMEVDPLGSTRRTNAVFR